MHSCKHCTIGNTVAATPTTSIRQLQAQNPGVTRSSIQRNLKKDLGMQGYRASLVQELKEDDPALWIEWAELWLEKVRQNPRFPDQVLWTDEAIFHLNGHVNRCNAITWPMTNPHISMHKPYQKKGIMVWAGVFKDQLIGPYFFTRGTVTGEKYLYMLKEVVWPIFKVLFEDDVPHMYYQQDGAPAHYLRGVRDWLNETFGTKWIGRGGPLEWPARSPDLTPIDFWLWGYLKEKVYAHNPKTVDQLQAVIAQERVHWTQQ